MTRVTCTTEVTFKLCESNEKLCKSCMVLKKAKYGVSIFYGF